MKVITSILLLLLIAVCASAQTNPNPNETVAVSVLNQKWRVDIRNLALEDDVFRGNNEHNNAELDRKDVLRQTESRARLPVTPPQVRENRRAIVIRPRGLEATYVYEVKIMNSSDKPIRLVEWEYAFFEKGTKEEAGRQKFVSKVSIEPGKSKTITVRTASPPTGAVDAAVLDKELRDQYLEQIVIRVVEFKDGSFWRAPAN